MPYVARKGITLAGVRYGPGEEIPLHDLDMSAKRVRTMIDQRRILLMRESGAAAGSVKPKLEAKAPVVKEAAEEVAEASEPEDESLAPKQSLTRKKKSAHKGQ